MQLVSSIDRFTGDGSTTTFTLSSTLTSVHLLAIKKNGLKLQPVDDFISFRYNFNYDYWTQDLWRYLLWTKLTNVVDFEEDTAYVEGGSSEGSYITKVINLENYQLF